MKALFSTLSVLPAILLCLVTAVSKAQNPIIQTNYTADPAPMAYNGKMYLYTTHDEDNSTWFTMNDWRLYTTEDMVNWTDHGAILSCFDFEWGKSDAWAAQCIERDGKFYMYVPMISKTNNRGAIGVAVADSPYGPFYDPLGKPLVQTEWGDIDPTVFIDDDGQAHLYWGNPKLYYLKLNKDMISYEGEVVQVPMVEESFGKRGDNSERPTQYEEGPWLYKRDKLWYLFWPGGPLPEFIGYSTSKSPAGPWKYGDIVMPAEGGAFTNHPGVVDFKGKTYFFYHNGALPGGGGFTRSVCVEEIKFNKDGSIPQMKMTSGIQNGVATLNPYIKNEAETIAWSEGVKSYQNKQVGVFITAKKDGSYTKVRDVDFQDNGPSQFFARVGTTHNGNVTMEVRIDGIDGQLLGTVKVPRTGGSDRWELVSTDVEKIKGIHDLYFVFRGRNITDVMYFDYWRFAQKTHNPIIRADVPDMSMIRVGDTYYMSSTTMHMNPGTPVMRSKNLVDWEIVSYAYETLGPLDAYELQNGKNAYGGGTWASSMRYHNGTFYISTFSNNSRKNYLFSTKDPEKTPWQVRTFEPMVHDHSLFFDDDGKTYIISCGGDVGIREMKSDLTGIKDEENKIVIENADAITGKERMLPAEGAQMFKVNGKYFLFLITWPKNSMRTVLVYRAENIMGPYEGRVALEDKGVAQGGFIDTPDGKWYGYFFRDYGAVGRIPYLVPMKWEDEWPVFGHNGIVPDFLNINAEQPAMPAIVASDEFARKPGERDLPLVWQWNHNPDNSYWSVSKRPGYLRLNTFRLNNSFTDAKNTLTQRTFGPECFGEIAMDVSKMKDGDFAGLGLLQQKYGIVGVKMVNGQKYIFAGNAQNSDRNNENYEEPETIPLTGKTAYFKVKADFKDRADTGYFYYSTDGKSWHTIGKPLKMEYTLTHFMGYRFALFNYATRQTGGYVDFDYFRLGTQFN